LFVTPLSIAEFTGIGRVNSPGKANLALCARTAHQGGLVGNTGEFRHPECFISGQSNKDGLFWVLFWAVAKEPMKIVMAPAVREPQGLIKKNKRLLKT